MEIYIIEQRPVRVISPSVYYKRKCEAYVLELEARNNKRLWGLHTACAAITRENYRIKTGKHPNLTELINNLDAADEMFEMFKIYANVWAYQMCNF